MYIAIDFDGTIVEDRYPNIGTLKTNADKVINDWFYAGHKIIISSCRSGELEKDAKEFLNASGIKFHCFNENHPDLIEKYQNDSRKIGADIYIDDKSLFSYRIDWLEIEQLMKLRKSR